jgi:hypothetical protein
MARKRSKAKGTAKIGVAKIVTLGRKQVLVAEFESSLRPADGEYKMVKIQVVGVDRPEGAMDIKDKRKTCFNDFRLPSCAVKWIGR